jgi:hypothetical protein
MSNTLRFSVRRRLALTKKSLFLEVPFIHSWTTRTVKVKLVLLQFDILRYSVHKMFRHKAQHADNGYSLGKCCNAVTGHLVIALRVSFSTSLTVLGLLTRE